LHIRSVCLSLLNRFSQADQKIGNIQIHILHAEVLLYEISLAESPLAADNDSSARVGLLYSCLLTCRAFFTAFFEIHPSQYLINLFVMRSQLSNLAITFVRLLLVNVEGWDLAHARSVIDFRTVLTQLIQNFETAGGDASVEENSFLQYARMVQSAKTKFDEVLVGAQTVDQVMGGDGLSADESFWREFIWEWGETV